MFDYLLESSRLDDSNKWSNIEIGEEIYILEIEICISYLEPCKMQSSTSGIQGYR